MHIYYTKATTATILNPSILLSLAPAASRTSMMPQIKRTMSGLIFAGRSIGGGGHSLTLAAVLLLSGIVGTSVAQAHPLESQSFSLRTIVRSYSATLDAWYTSHVHEFYSYDQARARLSINQAAHGHQSPEVQRSFYLDHLNLAVMTGDMPEGVKCKESSVDELNKLLYQDNPLPSERVDVDYIVGPARLLFLVDKYRYKMMPKEKHDSTFDRYELALTNEQGVKITFTVAYESKTVIQSEDAHSSLPIEIVMESGDSHKIVVRYSHINTLQLNSVVETSAQRLDGGVTIDPWALPAGIGCAKSLARKASEDLFSWRKLRGSSIRFSFKADAVYDSEHGKYHTNMFVAYESQLDSLRVDQLLPSGLTSVVRQKVFNFKVNRMYHLMDRAGSDPGAAKRGVLDGLIENDFADSDAGVMGADGRTQCILTTIQPREQFYNYVQPYSLGRLLVGGDRFVHLGRAQVRGLEAEVYESEDSAMPFWLDPPVVYSQQKKGATTRDPLLGVAGGNLAQPITLRTVLYFGAKLEDRPLLMIELYSDSNAKRTIHVHDFSWQLNEAPNGDQPRELFSLEDLCSANLNNSDTDANQYAKVTMLLESSAPATQLEKDPLLASTNDRDLAILAGLQESVYLPATMIYDLESRIVKRKRTNSKGPAAGTGQAMSVAFRVAQHPANLVEAVYLGQGKQNFAFKEAHFALLVRSFAECFALAAHRRRNTFFGFAMFTRICIIDMDTILDPKTLATKPQLFIMEDSPDSIEVFRTQHIFESNLAKEMSWIQRTSQSSAQLGYAGSGHIELKSVQDDEVLKFKILEFKVDDSDRKSSLGLQKDGSKQQTVEVPEKIAGFGLVEDRAQTQRLESKPVDSWSTASLYPQTESDLQTQEDFLGGPNDVAAMTFEQCQAACLSDLECRSFSVCVRRSEVQCVVSKKSLRLTPNFVEQLQQQRQAKLGRSGAKISVTNDDGQTLELALHPNCQLYSKHFLSLFARREPESLTLSQRELRPVRSRSECAELCLKRTVDFLRSDVDRLANFSANVAENRELVGEMLKERIATIPKRCESFRYLARSALAGAQQLEDQIYSAADELVRSTVAADQVEGYCIAGSVIMIGNQQAAPQERFYQFERYGFKTEFFFERHYGVRLLNTPSGKLVKGPNGGWVQVDGDGSHWQQIMDGRNTQLYEQYVSISGCARRCFFYGWGSPWPACRSFDIWVDESRDGSSYVCAMNTLTLAEAIAANKTDVFERVDSSGGRSKIRSVWHYEPRAGFALDESIFSGKLAAAADRPWERVSRQALKVGAKMGSQVGSFLVVLLALVTGVFAGIRLGQSLLGSQWPDRLMQRATNTTRTQDKQRIIDMDQMLDLGPADLQR